MDILLVATNVAIKTLDIAAAAFVDAEDDVLKLSNPLNKEIPVSFWNPDNVPLTFEGKPVETLEISPFTFVKLLVSKKNITAEKVLFNSEAAQGEISRLKAEIEKIAVKGEAQPKGLWKAQKEKIEELEEQVSTLESLIAAPVATLKAVPLIPAGEINPAQFAGMTVPYVKGETKFDVLAERAILKTELARLQSL